MDFYDTFPPEAKRLFDKTVDKVDRLDHPDHVVDDQRWIVRDLTLALIGMGIPPGEVSATILARCTINDDELVRSLLAFTSS